MGKRSTGKFERRERDFYSTPREAVLPLLPFLPSLFSFAEPCAGDGSLINHLNEENCYWASDIEPAVGHEYRIDKQDAFSLLPSDLVHVDYIITNPPWDRKVLHPMINHFRSLRPTWLLFDADWAFTKQASEYLKHCDMIVAVGRVKWIPDSKMTGKDNCAWYRFRNDNHACITEFVGR